MHNDLGGSSIDDAAPASPVWHVSPSVNRDSIATHGLDWGRIATGGIARGPGRGEAARPEQAGIFLCDSLDDVEFFVGFGQHALVDVWQVDASDLPLEPGPDGWLLCRRPIAAERLRLLHRDRPAEQRPLSSVAIAFISSSLGVGEMTRIAGIPADRTGEAGGDHLGFETGRAYTYWVLEGDDRYAGIEGQAQALIERIQAAETGLARLAAACDATRFDAFVDSKRWRPPADAVVVLSRLGAHIDG